MINSLKKLLDSLESELARLHQRESNFLTLSKKALVLARDYCREFSLRKHGTEFKDKSEEIIFFKEIKPIFYAKVYYYNDIHLIESQKPNGGEKLRRKYYKEQINKMNEHFNSHRSLYQYYRGGYTDLDDKYFSLIKRFDSKYDSNGSIMQCDDDYSSSHDILFARIISNELLEVYLTKELDKLYATKSGEYHNMEELESLNRMVKAIGWTDSKAAMTELVYGVVAASSINHGNVDIKKVMTVVERVFGIDMGDYYRTYTELRQRSNRTKYIDTIKTALLKKMDEDDEKD